MTTSNCGVIATTLFDIGSVTQRLPSLVETAAVGESKLAALLSAERAHGGQVLDRLAELGSVDVGLAEGTVLVDRVAQHVAAGGRADIGVLLARVEGDAVGELDLGRKHGQGAVGFDPEEEAVRVAGEGVAARARG